VDVGGNDSTGAVNDSSHPFLSVRGAVSALRNWRNVRSLGDNADGGIVKLNPGVHTSAPWGSDIPVNQEWVTITAEGAQESTVITAPGLITNISKVAVRGITLQAPSGQAYSFIINANGSMAAWVDNCEIIVNTRPTQVGWSSVYSTMAATVMAAMVTRRGRVWQHHVAQPPSAGPRECHKDLPRPRGGLATRTSIPVLGRADAMLPANWFGHGS